MIKLGVFDWRNPKGKAVRIHRQRWVIDPKTLAGRADVSVKALQAFEGGKSWKHPEVWRLQIGKALRQLIHERAQEVVKVYGAAIAADPDAADYTREAAARRRVKRYRMYDTLHVTQPIVINSQEDEPNDD